METIKVMPCKRPPFRNQYVINTSGVFSLDDERNSLVIQHNVLPKEYYENYLYHAVTTERKSGRSGFGQKPRSEVCYTTNGEPYKYSNLNHFTRQYPQHVLDIEPVLLDAVKKYIPGNKYVHLSNGVDIMYSEAFNRGGSISAHSDNEDEWGLVIIFSLGQTRYLRVRRISDKTWYNVEMPHNSLIAMHGATFQKLYTHQVDKLGKEERIGVRLSLNLRYKSVP